MVDRNYLLEDVAVFFEDFAKPYLINGKETLCIVDYESLKDSSKKEYDGISVGEILFYVKASDMEQHPKEGMHIIFGKRSMTVFSCRDEAGILEIVLNSNVG